VKAVKACVSPRIYNLFPRLLGKIPEWHPHLKRILQMQFNWIFVNPLNYSGFSGSLYSIKDYFKMSPLFAVDDKDAETWGSLKTFITMCHAVGVKFMVDLVINHTAIDAVEMHPGWYAEKFALIEKNSENILRFFEDDEDPVINEYPPHEYYLEKRIANPFAIDPADSRKITIWGDLAEINYNSDKKGEIMDYWKHLIDLYLKIGVDGFRCDAAYKLPREIWNEIIQYTKSKEPNAIFFGETLGCTLIELEKISGVFDYIASSSKYWDFTAPWALEQYEAFRAHAPSISFPESHDTPRLAFETHGREEIQKFRYLFSAFFSAGVLMPLGYEFGFQKKLDVVDGKPEDYEDSIFDLSSFIKEVNAFKAGFDLLNEDGPMKQFAYADMAVLVLRKSSIASDKHLLLIYNKDWNNYHHLYVPDLNDYLDLGTPIARIELPHTILKTEEKGLNRNLFPNEYLLFFQER
jgi:starch synthase (maltosyl-transferring)